MRLFDLTSFVEASEGQHKRRRFEEVDERNFQSCIVQDLSFAEDLSSDRRNDKAGPFPHVCFQGHTKSVTSTTFFEEDNIFLSSSLDGTIRLWSTSLAANICIFK